MRICKLHGTELKRMRVPIVYGEVDYDEAWAVQDRLFPKSNSYALGGCVVTPRSRIDKFLLSCRNCRAAEKAWRKQYAAYREAKYVVDDGPVQLEISIDSNNDLLDRLLKSRRAKTWAFLTAYNPLSQPLTDAENKTRQAGLVRWLEGREFPYLRGYGQGSDGEWPAEASLLILNISREEAIGVANQFSQNAILYGEIGEYANLVWCAF